MSSNQWLACWHGVLDGSFFFFSHFWGFWGDGGGPVMWHSRKMGFMVSLWSCLESPTRQTDSRLRGTGIHLWLSSFHCFLNRKKCNGFWVIQHSRLFVHLQSPCCYLLFCCCFLLVLRLYKFWQKNEKDCCLRYNIGKCAICNMLVFPPSQNFFPDQMVTWCQPPNGNQAQLLQVLRKTEFLLNRLAGNLK